MGVRNRTVAFSVAVIASVAALWSASPTGAEGPASEAPISVAGEVSLPAGFVDGFVASIPGAVPIEPLPDGRVLAGARDGRIWVVRDRVRRSTPSIDLSDVTCDGGERGLMGIAADPDFAENGFVYLFYTHSYRGACDAFSSAAARNRVSRFHMSGGIIQRSSERVLINGVLSFGTNHNGGDLSFGPDGYLYASFGDQGCDYRGDSGCQDQNDASRDRNTLLGKVVRITRYGQIPPDNPYTGPSSRRCNVGPTLPEFRCQETFGSGFRNPFRIAVDPNVSYTRVFVNDVGGGQWEEIDRLRSGADYGWNVREGFCVVGSQTSCGPPPSAFTNPISAYSHEIGCGSITGGAFVPNGAWPSNYDGGYLYADYTCGSIFLIKRNGAGVWQTPSTFASGLPGISPISLAFVSEDGGQSLYYTNLEGELRRITPPSSGNRAPTAVIEASPSSGDVPLDVTFSGADSTDPDGDPLEYRWSFGDGSAPEVTSGATVTHRYTTAGLRTASLVVSDGEGGLSRSATIDVRAGNRAPEVQIVSPAIDTRFKVGQRIVLDATATDAEDGDLAASSLTWNVIRHHATHTHPFLTNQVGDEIEFVAPSPEELAAADNSYLEVRVTATDSDGVSTTVRQDLRPRKTTLTFRTSPGGLTVWIEGKRRTAPYRVVSWWGFRVTIRADAQTVNGREYGFVRWSDAGARVHEITTPNRPTTYIAYYE